ncbi:hypothetical protein [Mycolicibacterium frederiksbergense]|uniref:hypothetical protein n=1 Tax=Mycolicibacterium frederiksbergense TaxID=117567 RepID=UPI00265BCF89|nr:hypothetical protein [Mycolicibacterium frederiksbergense]MDO0975772.1 hypothetical protein [Mycolicibacterium frederiksbergense]
MLGCAAGTATVTTHLPPWHIGLLVLAPAAVELPVAGRPAAAQRAQPGRVVPEPVA